MPSRNGQPVQPISKLQNRLSKPTPKRHQPAEGSSAATGTLASVSRRTLPRTGEVPDCQAPAQSESRFCGKWTPFRATQPSDAEESGKGCFWIGRCDTPENLIPHTRMESPVLHTNYRFPGWRTPQPTDPTRTSYKRTSGKAPISRSALCIGDQLLIASTNPPSG